MINGGKFDSMPYYPAGNQGAAILAPEPDHNYMAAYATYDDFAAANSGSCTYDSATNTLKLTGDYNGYVTASGDWSGFFLNRDVAIDLNGYTWDMKTSDGGYPFPFSEMVTNGGTEITIKDSSEEGTGTLKNRTGNVLEVMGTLNLEGGTLEMSGWTVKGNQNAFEFKPVENGTPGAIRLSISNGTIETGCLNTNNRADAICEITGGTFKNPVDEAYCANGYLSVKNEDGTYAVQESDAKAASVIDSQGNVTEYTTLGKALASAGEGDTVTLLTDVELIGSLTISGTLTLDLAGYTITPSSTSSVTLTVGTAGNLTIKDSKGNGTIRDILVKGSNNSTITVESGTINNSEHSNGITVSRTTTNAKVVVTGGTVKGQDTGINMAKGTVEITGGTITGGTTGVTIGYGSRAGVNSSVICTISGGNIAGGTNGIDILDPASQLTATGGTITGTDKNGINAEKSGVATQVTVENGTVTGGEYGIYGYCGRDSKFSVSGGALAGGTAALYAATGTPMTVTGGVFSSDPSAYCTTDESGTKLTGVANTDDSTKSKYPFMIGEASATAAEVVAGAPAVVHNADEGNTLANAAAAALNPTSEGAPVPSLSGAPVEAAAKDIAQANETTVEQGRDALTAQDVTVSDDATVTIVVQHYMDITVKDATSTDTEKSLILNITPMYRKVATTANLNGENSEIILPGGEETANAVQIASGKLDVTGDTTVTIPLPTNFANENDTVYIQHKGYEYTASVDNNYTITFVNPHGFSEFTLSTTSTAVAKVGDTSYTSFQDAVDAVAANGTITVLKDGLAANTTKTVTVTNGTEAGITVKINGNTQTIAASGSYTFTYTAPSSGGSGSSTYPITVPSTANGMVNVSPRNASRGTTVTVTVSPDEGYELDKLTVTDRNGDPVELTDKGDGKYSFTMPSSRVTVSAKFAEQVWTNPYTDVSTGDWYYNAVKAVSHGLIGGQPGNLLNPTGTASRAEVAQILMNFCNVVVK